MSAYLSAIIIHSRPYHSSQQHIHEYSVNTPRVLFSTGRAWRGKRQEGGVRQRSCSVSANHTRPSEPRASVRCTGAPYYPRLTILVEWPSQAVSLDEREHYCRTDEHVCLCVFVFSCVVVFWLCLCVLVIVRFACVVGVVGTMCVCIGLWVCATSSETVRAPHGPLAIAGGKPTGVETTCFNVLPAFKCLYARYIDRKHSNAAWPCKANKVDSTFRLMFLKISPDLPLITCLLPQQQMRNNKAHRALPSV